MVMLFSFIVHLILSSFHQKQMKKRIPEKIKPTDHKMEKIASFFQ